MFLLRSWMCSLVFFPLCMKNQWVSGQWHPPWGLSKPTNFSPVSHPYHVWAELFQNYQLVKLLLCHLGGRSPSIFSLSLSASVLPGHRSCCERMPLMRDNKGYRTSAGTLWVPCELLVKDYLITRKKPESYHSVQTQNCRRFCGLSS